MALGRRTPQEQSLWVATQDLPSSPGHPFYERLNKLLGEADFDVWVERLCAPHYKEVGRPSIPPGVYFRMLFVGYFEGIGSQRGIAWRCSDSLALRAFLGLTLEQSSPDHSSLTVIRRRLSYEVHHEVFLFVLKLATGKGMLKGKTVAVDSTTLEANAAMKAIVRRESNEEWKDYLRRLLKEEEGIDDPSDDDLRRFDKKRKKQGKKKVSNKEWKSPSDEDSRIARLKDGRTHLAYKAEHTVDLESELIVGAEVLHADVADTASLLSSLEQARENLEDCGAEGRAEEVVADKGYHKGALLAACEAAGHRTYIPEPKQRAGCTRRWVGKPQEEKAAVLQNRRRTRGRRGRRLQRKRSERAERGFAHTCETGGGRRSWLRGIPEVQKRHLIHVAARNLGTILRRLFGVGTPRGLQGAKGTLNVAVCFLAVVEILVGWIELVSSTPQDGICLPTWCDTNRPLRLALAR